MATRRHAPAAEPQTPPVNPDDEWRAVVDSGGANAELGEPEREVTPADRVQAMLSDVRGDERAKVKLLRYRPDGRFEWCADYTPNDFEQGGFEMIRRDWGAAKYRVVLYGTLPGGAYGIRAREELNIAAPAATALVKPAADGASLADVARMLIESQERQAQMIAAALAPKQAESPMAQLAGMLAIFKDLRTAFAPDAPPRDNIANTLETMRLLRETALEFHPNGPPQSDDKSELMGMARQVLDIVATARGGGGQQAQPVSELAGPPVTLPASIEAPAETAGAEPAPSSDSNDPEAAMLKILFKSYIDTLLKQAQANAPVAQTAQIVADKLPDPIVAMLDLPDWWDKLAAFDARVVPHQAYLTQVRDAALKLLFTEE